MARVCIVSRHNLTRNTRVSRQAQALAAAGHEVTVAAVRLPPAPPGIELVEVPLWKGRPGPGTRLAPKRTPAGGSARRLLADEAATRSFAAGVASALEGRRFDVVQAHDTYSLPAADRLARASGAVLGLDAVEMAGHRPDRAGWLARVFGRRERRQAARYLPRAAFVITVGDRLADWYEAEYSIPRPVVVRNARSRREPNPDGRIRADCGIDDDAKLVAWIGSAKPYQGLEVLIEAAALLPDDVQVALLATTSPGFEPYVESIRTTLPPRVHFLPEREPATLVDYIAGADAGAITLLPVTLNVVNALPNKFFELVAARLPLVAPRELLEIASIMERYGLGELFEAGSAVGLAEALRTVLGEGGYRAAVSAAANELCREGEEERFLDVYRSLGLG